jgi:hypothetical protein
MGFVVRALTARETKFKPSSKIDLSQFNFITHFPSLYMLNNSSSNRLCGKGENRLKALEHPHLSPGKTGVKPVHQPAFYPRY